MNLIQIYQDDISLIKVDNKAKYLEACWHKQPASANFRQTKALALDYALKHNLTLWLCDMRQIIYLNMEDQNWLVREIFAAFNTHTKHEIAYVINTTTLELATTFLIHELVKNYPELQSTVKVEIFFEIEIARQWLFDTAKYM